MLDTKIPAVLQVEDCILVKGIDKVLITYMLNYMIEECKLYSNGRLF